MSEQHLQKQRRLEAMRRRVPYVSQSALSAILIDVRDNGMPAVMNRYDMRKGRDALLLENTRYGKILRTLQLNAVDGTAYLVVAQPLPTLLLAVRECAGF